MGEAQFLHEQSEQAKAAMGAVLTHAKADALRAIDPRAWARSHPWKSIAAAAIAGFLAGDTIARPERPVTDTAAAAEEEPPRKQPSAGRIIVKILKRTRMIMAFVEPFLAELWAAQTGAGNGTSGDGKPSQPATSAGFDTPNRP
jgi:hypothetical protein